MFSLDMSNKGMFTNKCMMADRAEKRLDKFMENKLMDNVKHHIWKYLLTTRLNWTNPVTPLNDRT